MTDDQKEVALEEKNTSDPDETIDNQSVPEPVVLEEQHAQSSDESNVVEDGDEVPDESASQSSEKEQEVSGEPEASADESAPRSNSRSRNGRSRRGGRKKRQEDAPAEVETDAAEDSDIELDQDEPFLVDDLHTPAYDLEQGNIIDSSSYYPTKLPWKSKIDTPKEFFNAELLYRFDIIPPEELEPLKGSYRIELKGAQGGIWSLEIENDLNVVNRKEQADTVLVMQQRDFMQIVNGLLNPQLALLSQKVKVTGDVKKAIVLQELLVPAAE